MEMEDLIFYIILWFASGVFGYVVLSIHDNITNGFDDVDIVKSITHGPISAIISVLIVIASIMERIFNPNQGE